MGNAEYMGPVQRYTDVMKLAIAAILSVCVALSAAYPYPQSNEFAQERDGAPSYGKQPDGYFQYVNVPAHKSTSSAGTEATRTTTSRATSRARTTDSGPGFGGATSTAGTASSTGSTTTRPSTWTTSTWTRTTRRPSTTRPPPKEERGSARTGDSTLTKIHPFRTT